MTDDQALDEIARLEVGLDQTLARVLEDMRAEPNLEQLGGFLLELEEDALRLRELRRGLS